MNKLAAFFSKRSVGLFIIFLAVVHRIINVLFVSYYGRDKLFLVMQSKSLLGGKGLSVPQYFTSDTVNPAYDFTPLWPPGYPIVLSPFLKLFNYNIYWATTTLDIIVCIALILVIRKICGQIGFSAANTNIMTLVVGCFEYTFINESLPTDTISLVLFLLGFSLVLRTVFSQSFSVGRMLAVSFVLFLPCVFRYNYPAVTFSLIAALLFIGYLKRDVIIKKKAWFLFAFVFLFTAIFFIIMKSATGHAGYATATERGFYPENVIHWFPVVPSSFINIAFLTSQLIKITGISFYSLMLVLEIINVIVVLALLFFFLKLVFAKKTYQDLSPFKLFMITGGVASIGLLILLAYMSLTYKVQTGGPNNWNYVYEPRYFAFAVIFLQLVFIGAYFIYYRTAFIKNVILKIIGWICLFLLFVEIVHNIYFHTKVAFNFNHYKSSVYREQDYSYYIDLIKDMKGKYPGYEIWAAAPGDNFYQYLASYHGHKGFADATGFRDKAVRVNKNTILIFMLYDHEIEKYNSFLSGVTILQREKKQNSNFFVMELKP